MLNLRSRSGFTLLEMIVVVIIIGILATLAFTQYGGYQEKVVDREAQANLLLILAGERIARMESNDNFYVVPAAPLVNDNGGINTLLKMTLPVTNPKWNYTVTLLAAGSAFRAQAARNWPAGSANAAKNYYICSPNAATPDPQPDIVTCAR